MLFDILRKKLCVTEPLYVQNYHWVWKAIFWWIREDFLKLLQLKLSSRKKYARDPQTVKLLVVQGFSEYKIRV